MSDTDELIKLLNESGYKTVEGKEKVLKAIKDKAGHSKTRLCSGYGVFPGGDKCPGCSDCNETK